MASGSRSGRRGGGARGVRYRARWAAIQATPKTGLSRLAVSTHKQSILQDMELGRSMEVDALLRVPLELVRMAEVATTTLDLIVGLAVQRARAAGCKLTA